MHAGQRKYDDARHARERVGALLDLENLLHVARTTSAEAVRAAMHLVAEELFNLGEVRFSVGCCDWWLAKMLVPVAGDLGVRVHPGPFGPDRADEELLRRVADVPASVTTLVIGSGDGIFARVAYEQRAVGRRVVVVARPASLSPALACACDRVIDLTQLDHVLAA